MTEREKEIYWKGYNDALGAKGDGGIRMMLSKRAKIENVVCEYFRVSMSDLSRPTRKRTITYPRQMLIYFLSMKTTMGCVAISRIFNQDHTSILHSVKNIKNMLSYDEEVQGDVMALELRITKVLEVLPDPQIVWKKPESVNENEITFFHRPKAEYSNTGHLKLINELSEAM